MLNHNKLLYTSALAQGGIAARIAEITTIFGGREPTVPQEYHDDVAAEFLGMSHIMGFTHTAVQDGDWSDTNTWDTGTVPSTNAVVQVGNYNVVYDGNSTDKIKDIHVGGGGSLTWATDQDTLLWVDTIMCMGELVIGTQQSPIPESSTNGKARAEIVFHQHTAPGTSARLGLMAMGLVRIYGARKTDRLAFTSVSSGAASVTISGVSSSNWRIGDQIIFMATTNAGTSGSDSDYTGPTQFYGPFSTGDGVRTQTLGFHQSRDEVRTITAIDGNTISWSGALSYDHTTTTHTFANGNVETAPAFVVNTSRSIKFRSESIDSLQERAHAMFMHNDDIDIRYLEVFNMGRQASDPSQVRPEGIDVLDEEDGEVITDANNVRGRYALHIHKTGQYFGRKQVRVIGCAVHAGVSDPPIPGWAMVHHNSRAAFENNVVYNVRGAGMVAEVGNEIGQWKDNSVIWCRGDGFAVDWGSRAELWTNHNGHAGVAYEMQARQILCTGNIASSCHFAWLYLQQTTNIATRIPDEHSMRYFDPISSGYGIIGLVGGVLEDKYGVEQAQIPRFDHNYVYGCRIGFAVAHRQFTDRLDNVPMIAKHFHCIETNAAVHVINYTFNYHYFDSIWTGPGSTNACLLGNVGWQFGFTRIYLENFANGFVQNGIGLNYDGLWIDIESDSVDTLFDSFDVTNWDISGLDDDITNHAMYGVMGPWTTSSQVGSTWSGTIRQYANIDSTTDLPVHLPNWANLATEPSSGTTKPYFTLDPSADTTLGGKNSINIWGIITDSVGNRRWPDTFNSESFSPSSTYSLLQRQNVDMDATDIVERNGCFYDSDAEVWKTRLWFTSLDRLTGEPWQFYIDCTLTGVDSGVLTANQVDPSVSHDLALLPERTNYRTISFTYETPTIITEATAAVNENQELAIALQADTGHVTWSKSGADSAQFEIATVSGVQTLRWASNGTKDFEAPADADTNNAYQVTVTATSLTGAASTLDMTVSVANDESDDGFALNSIANCRGWWKLSDTASITHNESISGSAGVVTNINDKSGEFNHIVSFTGSPTTGTRTVNGKNCVDLSPSDKLHLPSDLYDISTGESTIIAIIAHDNPSYIHVGLIQGREGANSRYTMSYNTNPGTFLTTAGTAGNSNAVARDANAHVWGFRSGTIVEPFVDGVELASTSARTNTTLTDLIVGGANGPNGRYCEFAIYDRRLTDAELNQIGAYAIEEWATSWTDIT